MEEAVKGIEHFSADIKNYEVEAAEIRKNEELLGFTASEFDLDKLKYNLKPFEDLWFLIRDKKEKIEGWRKKKQAFDLDPEEIEKDVKQMYSTAQKLKVQFVRSKVFQLPLKLTETVITDLNEFKKHIPLARVLSNKGLKDRHWTVISEILSTNVHPSKKDYLSRFIDMDLVDDKYKQLEEISDTASKEYSIEKILQKM